MPWNAHLFIGQPVHDCEELREVLRKLEIYNENIDDDDLFDGSVGKHVELTLRSKTFKAWIVACEEQEGGCPFPVSRDNPYTDAAVALNLTNRYKGAILDADTPHGRHDPFCFDPEDILELLQQVRTFWPEARAMIWDRHF